MQKMIALIVGMFGLCILPAFGFQHDPQASRRRLGSFESPEELLAAMAGPREVRKVLVVNPVLAAHPYQENVASLLQIARARGITAWFDGSDSKYMSHLLATELHRLATRNPRVFLALCSTMVEPEHAHRAREVLYELTLKATQREYAAAKAASAQSEITKRRLAKDKCDLENEIVARDKMYNILQERKR